MTELEKLTEQALYQEVQTLEDGRSIVKDNAGGKLFYKKRLSVFNPDVFVYLKAHRSRYVPRIEAFWKDGEELVVIEEFIQGKTLEELLTEAENGNTLPFEERIRILTELCNGLSFLHSADPPIIHRDLKASNIMLTEDGVVKIIDYDAAKLFVKGQKRDTQLIGTQGSAAPEQYGFAASDARTDIYALGKLIERILPQNADAARIAARATHMDPAKRYASAAQMREQIRRIREKPSGLDNTLEKVPGYDPRSKAHRITSRAALAGLLLFLVLASVFFYDRKVSVPRRQQQEIAALQKDLSEGSENREGDIEQITQFLQKWSYQSLGQDQQKQFRAMAEKVITDNCRRAKSTQGAGNMDYLSALRDLGVDEKSAENIRVGGITAYMLEKKQYRNAIGMLSALNGLPDEEEIRKQIVDESMTYARQQEELFAGEAEDTVSGEILTLYELLLEEETAGAEQAYAAFYEKVLNAADKSLEEGGYEKARELYQNLKVHAVPQSLAADADIEKRLAKTAYQRGKAELDAGEYVTGRDCFKEAGDYENAPELADECAYLQAARLAKEEKYTNAVKLYDEISSYKDAEALGQKARFDYCVSTKEMPDNTSYKYLDQLISSDYPGITQVRDEIYRWHARIDTGIRYRIGSEQAAEIRATLYGGPDGASTRVSFELTDTVTGYVNTWTSEENCKRGEYTTAYYRITTSEYSIFDREFIINVYDDDGNQIGSWSGLFKDEFLRD